MLLSVDMVSETPIYTQICHQIIRAIATGRLTQGDELPSVRGLAADLGVNFHTISKAYTTLKEGGFLVINRRKGVVVNKEGAYSSDPTYEEALRSQMEILVTESMARGLDHETLNNMIAKIIEDVKGE